MTAPDPAQHAGGGPVRVVVLADTHLRCDSRRLLSAGAWGLLGQADVILHAGDVVEPCLLDQLAAIAPTYAVLGNNDTALVGTLPEIEELELAGVRVAMVHDAGPATGRPGRLARRFAQADVVVFGHSHIPWNGPGLGHQLLFNPGSPTQRRRQPHHTAGVLVLHAGRVASAEVLVVD